MAFLQVNLQSASVQVVKAFREFSHIETDANDVIIVAASQTELEAKLLALQVQAASEDTNYDFPVSLQEVSVDAVINNKTVGEQFTELFSHIGDAA